MNKITPTKLSTGGTPVKRAGGTPALHQSAGFPNSNDFTPLPKLCGADLELGNFITGTSDTDTGYQASRALLREIDGVASQALTIAPVESTGGYGYFSPSYSAAGKEPAREPGADSQDWGRKFLFNGGCAYVDLNHLEVCIPEVISAYDHVAYCHAMYRLAHRASLAATERLPAGQKIHVLANNSDGRGNSFGSHLNFLISRRSWEDIFHRRLHHQGFLAAYQASSMVFTGQGKVGAENGAPAVRYQLSQRADFVEIVSGPQTTFRRPLLNSRDESLCGGWRSTAASDSPTHKLARLHVIFYDHNLCHGAALLKVGVMQIILAMLEAGNVNPDLLLDDPVQAAARWSHDPLLKMRAPLVSGVELTAVELQLRFFESAERFVAAGGGIEVVPHAEEILRLWGDTLQKLKAGQMSALAPRLDWVLKLSILQQAMQQRPELNWDSPAIKHLDHLYSSLDPAEGLFWAYEKRGFVERLVTEAQIARCLHEPPTNTRAWTRAMLLLMADPTEVDQVDWDLLRFKLTDRTFRSSPRYFTLNLANPLHWTRADTSRFLPEAGTLKDALAALAAVESSSVERTGLWTKTTHSNSWQYSPSFDSSAGPPASGNAALGESSEAPPPQPKGKHETPRTNE